MTKVSKRRRTAAENFDPAKLHTPTEAVEIVRANASAKFDETIEMSMKLGIDPRKADQIVRGSVTLPAGTGRPMRVAVFAAGDAAREAQEAGADVVGDDDLIERISGGWFEFDAAVATPDMMPKVGRIGKILGPRGLMPNPKAGTVTTEVGKAVEEIKGGKVEYRADRYGNVHLILGKASFSVEDILRNFAAALDEITRAKPSAAKGRYIRSITISSTMGAGVRVDPNTSPREAVPGTSTTERAVS